MGGDLNSKSLLMTAVPFASVPHVMKIISELIKQCLGMRNDHIDQKIFKNCHQRFLSLVEMLLVMALVAMVAGLAAINIRRVVVEQRFLSDVERVVDLLRVAQNLSLIVGHDTSATLSSTGKQPVIECKMAIDKLLPKASGEWQKEIDRARTPLKNVKRIDFNEQTVLANRTGEIALHFRSQGTIVPTGVMRLSSSIEEGDKTAL